MGAGFSNSKGQRSSRLDESLLESGEGEEQKDTCCSNLHEFVEGHPITLDLIGCAFYGYVIATIESYQDEQSWLVLPQQFTMWTISVATLRNLLGVIGKRPEWLVRCSDQMETQLLPLLLILGMLMVITVKTTGETSSSGKATLLDLLVQHAPLMPILRAFFDSEVVSPSDFMLQRNVVARWLPVLFAMVYGSTAIAGGRCGYGASFCYDDAISLTWMLVGLVSLPWARGIITMTFWKPIYGAFGFCIEKMASDGDGETVSKETGMDEEEGVVGNGGRSVDEEGVEDTGSSTCCLDYFSVFNSTCPNCFWRDEDLLESAKDMCKPFENCCR